MPSVVVALALTGCKKEEAATPPYAASDKTWKIGDYTWSDAIHDPACNKEDFDGGGDGEAPKADGRSYTFKGSTYYYYTWPYVDQRAAELCPSPWRVPTKDDFINLDKALGGDGTTRDADQMWIMLNYVDSWGGAYSGYAYNAEVRNTDLYANYWSSSSTEFSSDTKYAYCLFFNTSGKVSPRIDSPYDGYQVRCVK
ncbi:MAG: fibrobacter succinogenes major paralogous domain-containing protein [Prevotellaceae bacterium]|nr:fibrobacter succinogenes major paralogous domain-containing protein [Prevotellaceae bacterium]